MKFRIVLLLGPTVAISQFFYAIFCVILVNDSNISFTIGFRILYACMSNVLHQSVFLFAARFL